MKSVLMSIQPKWCELIASGKKTVEVRKTRPKLETPFKCYIYCTNEKGRAFFTKGENGNYAPARLGNRKIIGEFVCDKIYQYSTTQNCNGTDITDEEMTKASCLTKENIEAYEFSAEAKDFCIYKIGVYGWHISDLVIYDKPRELSEFKRDCDGNCQSCKYAIWQTNGWAYEPYIADCKPITRPPQSWCYVESEGEG